MGVKYIAPAHGSVVDIGGSRMKDTIQARLTEILATPYDAKHPPTLPDELLYDDNGLPIWNKIIFTPEFYQTHDEIEMFDKNGADIAKCVSKGKGVTLIDLGAGDTRKVGHLLKAFEDAKIEATYLALDISKSSLEHNVGYLADRHSGKNRYVTCAGIWGTFEHGLEYVEKIQGPRMFLSLGSVLCNDHWPEALRKVKLWANVLRADDWLFVGMDAHVMPLHEERIWAAYHTRDDLYEKFFLNGFDHANRLLAGTADLEEADRVFKRGDWDFRACLEQQPTTRHRFYFEANKNISHPKLSRTIFKGEVVDWFDSHKYAEYDVRMMINKADLSVDRTWQAPDSEFRQYLVRKGKNKSDSDSAISGVN